MIQITISKWYFEIKPLPFQRIFRFQTVTAKRFVETTEIFLQKLILQINIKVNIVDEVLKWRPIKYYPIFIILRDIDKPISLIICYFYISSCIQYYY